MTKRILKSDRERKRKASDKVIHIRINETTHRKLKIEAASSGTSIQAIVEKLIERKIHRSRTPASSGR